ncbi:hypothetical protein AAFF_G00333600 [Aldrovandia affinis]|uniref:Uncharacterized protein n=1 Tax=Aldrovandia affinis TaxID=143900 RepID=A0AAD7R6R3_9TELE|nr:hypothetical protein AAFF_G00333600 [Aldrovandia affinis]
MNTAERRGPLSCSTNRLEEQKLKQTHPGQLQTLMEEQWVVLQRVLLQSSSGVKVVPPTGLAPHPSSRPPSHRRPLVAAAVKGYLTRRLLRTERLTQLQRTVKDMLQFLLTLRSQTPGELLLKERVLLQLRSARYEIHDIFFSFSSADRMLLISWDRELLCERQIKHKVSGSGRTRGLSAATVKVLERKRSGTFQKRAAESKRGRVGGACRLPYRPSLSIGPR